jgi:HD-GYP domain-containing protein (c-di-GMP phosphodiesterase class II)
LSQLVAEELRLPRKQVDDIRVAALLHEMGNTEITAKIINRAFGQLEQCGEAHTFRGTELVRSLGGVLEGALPLLVIQDDAVSDYLAQQTQAATAEMPIGARIIRAVRVYDDSVQPGTHGDAAATIQRMAADLAAGYGGNVVKALERVVQERVPQRAPAPAAV